MKLPLGLPRGRPSPPAGMLLVAWGRVIRARVSALLVSGKAFTLRARAELLTGAAFVGGWLLVTWGVAELTTRRIWPISLGVLLLSAGGWALLWEVIREGLYTLTRPPKDKR